METPEFAVLRTFRSLFEGTRYKPAIPVWAILSPASFMKIW